jgi:hypothetical protein
MGAVFSLPIHKCLPLYYHRGGTAMTVEPEIFFFLFNLDL